MPKKKATKAKRKATKVVAKNYVTVQSARYGKALQGIPIYFEGKRPTKLQADGTIGFGKHILETLQKKFPRFRWIITPSTDSITTEYGIVRVRTSQALLTRMGKETWERSRDIKHDIVSRFFSSTFPDHFEGRATTTYVPGTLARIVDVKILPRLSSADKEALRSFVPEYVATEAVGTVQKLQASAQIETLRALAENLEKELERSHPESWWQDYVRSNILLMQQGYIKAIDKMNVAVGDTKFPDFCLVTHDNYLDILEIKRADTGLLKLDTSRGNYFWDPEMAKAISQTENYIDQVSTKADAVRTHLLDHEGINVKAVRPRGIILAGDARRFTEQKQSDDFRLLSQGIKNITVLTYDELLTRLNNYIGVLEEFSKDGRRTAKGKKKRKSAKSDG